MMLQNPSLSLHLITYSTQCNCLNNQKLSENVHQSRPNISHRPVIGSLAVGKASTECKIETFIIYVTNINIARRQN
jgi:hypothetical protein